MDEFRQRGAWPGHGWLTSRVALVAIGAMIAACEYDPDSLCGRDQQLKDDLCYCNEGFALKNGTCVASAAGAGGAPMGGAGAGGTGGDDGGDDAGSIDAGAGQGAACSADSDCTDATYGKCVTMNASSGYCSRTGCSGDCEAGYFCATDASPSYCKRLPTGEGATCTLGGDECMGNDASYCTLNPAAGTYSCVVPDCADGGCSPAFSMCFDLSTFVPGQPKICVPAD